MYSSPICILNLSEKKATGHKPTQKGRVGAAESRDPPSPPRPLPHTRGEHCRQDLVGMVGARLIVQAALLVTTIAVGAASPSHDEVPMRMDLIVRAADKAQSRMQELSDEQLLALYSMLDDDGDGSLTVHEVTRTAATAATAANAAARLWLESL